jgi:hypothetical protein
MPNKNLNKMTLDELLNKQREEYITTYKLGLSQKSTNKSAIEIMLETTSDQNRSLPEVYRINRYDLVNVNSQGKFDLVEFNLDKDSIILYDKHSFVVEDLKVDISPFVWNGCEFSVDRKPNITFDNWARKWLDIDEKKTETPDGFLNVIHSVTSPIEKNEEWTISIDFGSSKPDAFKELLSILSKQGIRKVKVHSKTFLD